MAKYKVIYRDENCAWSEGCPIQVSAVQISRDTTSGACYLQTRLRNISSNRCSSIEFVVDLADAAGNAEKIEFKLLDADLPAGGTMAPQAKKMSLSEVTGAEATVTRVDDTHGFGVKVAISNTESLELGKDLLTERAGLLTDASVKAILCSGKHHEHEGWWQCSCGAVNLGRDTCWNCGAPLGLLRNADSAECLAERVQQKSYDEAIAKLEGKNPSQVAAGLEALKSLSEQGFKDAESRLEVGEKRLEEVEAERIKNAKRNKRIAMATAALLVIAAGGFVAFSAFKEQAQKQAVYEQAGTAFESGKYADALYLYESLGSYKDSESKANEVKAAATPEEVMYQRALHELELGNFTPAIKHFDSLGAYKDSAAKADEAREAFYQKAVSALDSGDYTSSAGMFDTLGDYADAAELSARARSLAGK